MAQYNDAVQKANDNLKAFLKVKADQSATRADFEATRQKALETSSALSTLLGKLSELSSKKISLKQTLGLEVGENLKK
jgi:BMFP domain-containing protein YqiC